MFVMGVTYIHGSDILYMRVTYCIVSFLPMTTVCHTHDDTVCHTDVQYVAPMYVCHTHVIKCLYRHGCDSMSWVWQYVPTHTYVIHIPTHTYVIHCTWVWHTVSWHTVHGCDILYDTVCHTHVHTVRYSMSHPCTVCRTHVCMSHPWRTCTVLRVMTQSVTWPCQTIWGLSCSTRNAVSVMQHTERGQCHGRCCVWCHKMSQSVIMRHTLVAVTVAVTVIMRYTLVAVTVAVTVIMRHTLVAVTVAVTVIMRHTLVAVTSRHMLQHVSSQAMSQSVIMRHTLTDCNRLQHSQ